MAAFNYCNDCMEMVHTNVHRVHVCKVYEKGVLVKTLKKEWNHQLRAWDLIGTAYEATPEKVQKAVVDRELGKDRHEGYESCGWSPRLEKKVVIEKAPCATNCLCKDCRPSRIKHHIEGCNCWDCWTWKKDRGAEVPKFWEAKANYGYSSYSYEPTKPWEGIDYQKWPNTWMWLFTAYNVGTGWFRGKYVEDRVYKARILEGKYEPEKPDKWPWNNYDYGEG